ncbi:MAG TPA: hypothetical protein VKD67_10130 [Acidimicrobiales bacterium]|nr:hypothetical protein [Acidimicrobiales bacterium]
MRRYLVTQGREGIPAVRIGTALRIPRTGLVDLLLSTPTPIASGVGTTCSTVASQLLAGVNIDNRGLDLIEPNHIQFSRRAVQRP